MTDRRGRCIKQCVRIARKSAMFLLSLPERVRFTAKSVTQSEKTAAVKTRYQSARGIARDPLCGKDGNICTMCATGTIVSGVPIFFRKHLCVRFLILVFLLGVNLAHAQEMTNRLIKEKSPYLLQHAHNPVDWYPWGDEAFQKAKKEDKPVFLSIGYSTCHWCHVMEEESYSSPQIAPVTSRIPDRKKNRHQ